MKNTAEKQSGGGHRQLPMKHKAGNRWRTYSGGGHRQVQMKHTAEKNSGGDTNSYQSNIQQGNSQVGDTDSYQSNIHWKKVRCESQTTSNQRGNRWGQITNETHSGENRWVTQAATNETHSGGNSQVGVTDTCNYQSNTRWRNNQVEVIAANQNHSTEIVQWGTQTTTNQTHSREIVRWGLQAAANQTHSGEIG